MHYIVLIMISLLSCRGLLVQIDRSMESSPEESHYYANYQSNFELSELFEFDEWAEEEDPAFVVSGYPQNPVYYAANEVNDAGGSSSHHGLGGPTSSDSRSGREKKEIKEKVAFKTKSEVEILDDGFKWRKYGKKMVKNSPHPRNYYRCSAEGCPVKKRVERDREDPREQPRKCLRSSSSSKRKQKKCLGENKGQKNVDTKKRQGRTYWKSG